MIEKENKIWEIDSNIDQRVLIEHPKDFDLLQTNSQIATETVVTNQKQNIDSKENPIDLIEEFKDLCNILERVVPKWDAINSSNYRLFCQEMDNHKYLELIDNDTYEDIIITYNPETNKFYSSSVYSEEEVYSEEKAEEILRICRNTLNEYLQSQKEKKSQINNTISPIEETKNKGSQDKGDEYDYSLSTREILNQAIDDPTISDETKEVLKCMQNVLDLNANINSPIGSHRIRFNNKNFELMKLWEHLILQFSQDFETKDPISVDINRDNKTKQLKVINLKEWKEFDTKELHDYVLPTLQKRLKNAKKQEKTQQKIWSTTVK